MNAGCLVTWMPSRRTKPAFAAPSVTRIAKLSDTLPISYICNPPHGTASQIEVQLGVANNEKVAGARTVRTDYAINTGPD